MINNRLSNLVLAIAATGSISSLASAAEPAADNSITEELIITANRLLQPQGSALAATTVINEADIRASLASNVADLLAGVPGMQFARTGGQGGQTSLFLRGSESDHTLVLIDGVKVNTASEGFARLEFIPVDQISRIEVVRGPRSSIYGSEAIGGVVQIFTRQAKKDNFSGSATVSAGTEQTRNASLNLAGNVESTAYTLSYVRNDTDGIDASQGEFSSDDRDGVKSDSFSASLSHALSADTSLKASFLQTDSESEFDDGTNDATSRQASVSADFKLQDNWRSNLSASYFEDDNENISFFGSESNTERVALNWQNNIELADHSALAIGVDYQDEELYYNSGFASETDTSRDNLGLYAVYVAKLAPLDYTVSLRHDDNEQFGEHTTGSIALGHNLTDTIQLWVSYGTAFKAPNLVDLYVDFPNEDFPEYSFYGNPDLKPESSESFEIGVEGTLSSTRWSVNAFHNEIEDLIASDASFTSLTNVGQTEINGLEATVGTELAGWFIDAALTLLDHENEDTGEKLLRRPNETFNLSLARDFGDFDVAANWLLQGDHDDVDPVTFGRSHVAGYGIVDLKFGYEVTPELKLRLKVGNLFDQDYEVVDGFNTYGTTALVSADYVF